MKEIEFYFEIKNKVMHIDNAYLFQYLPPTDII